MAEDRLFLTEFMFGNIDEDGDLENKELFDGIVSSKHFSALHDLEIEHLLADKENTENDSCPANLSDITELAENTVETQSVEQPDRISQEQISSGQIGKISPIAANRQNQDTRLKIWFPNYDRNKVPRFSQIFKPIYKYDPWKQKSLGAKDKVGHEQDVDDKVCYAEDHSPDLKDVASRAEDNNEDGYYQMAPVPCEVDTASPSDAEVEVQDDLVRLLNDDSAEVEEKHKPKKKSNVAEWRYGPAKLWYDLLNVDEGGNGFDYGFKLKSNGSTEDDMPLYGPKVEIPDEHYLMVCQKKWEDDIIYDGDEVRDEVMQSMSGHGGAAAGWVATPTCQTLSQYWVQHNGSLPSFLEGVRNSRGQQATGVETERLEPNFDNWKSIFPVENRHLLFEKWEDNIILDAEAMPKIPTPQVLTIELDDEEILIRSSFDEGAKGMTDDEDEARHELQKRQKRRSKMLLGKAGLLTDMDEEEDPTVAQYKDPFNISNDEYYSPKWATESALKTNLGVILVQHSTPAIQLQRPYFPTHMGPIKLRNFHRPKLKRNPHLMGLQPVQSLEKQLRKKVKMRDQERFLGGGGDMFFMRTSDDLTGKDDHLVLAEYSEEYPPLMMQVGMATRIKNFYKRVVVLRLFTANKDKPKRIRMEEVKNAFPSLSEGTIRKKLKMIADFKRTDLLNC